MTLIPIRKITSAKHVRTVPRHPSSAPAAVKTNSPSNLTELNRILATVRPYTAIYLKKILRAF